MSGVHCAVAAGAKSPVVPNPLNWDNITFVAPGSGTNSNLTVTGSRATGNMRVSWTGTSGLSVSVSGTGGDGAIASGGEQTFEPAETLGFGCGASTSGSNTVTIEYEAGAVGSGIWVVWDTFTVTRT